MRFHDAWGVLGREGRRREESPPMAPMFRVYPFSFSLSVRLCLPALLIANEDDLVVGVAVGAAAANAATDDGGRSGATAQDHATAAT